MRSTGVRPLTWLLFYVLWVGAYCWLAALDLGVHDAGLRWMVGAAVLYVVVAAGYRWRRRTAVADALAGRADPDAELMPAVDRAAREIRTRVRETWMSPALVVLGAAVLGVGAGHHAGPFVAAPGALVALAGCHAFVVQRRVLRTAERWAASRPPGPPWDQPRSSWPRPSTRDHRIRARDTRGHAA